MKIITILMFITLILLISSIYIDGQKWENQNAFNSKVVKILKTKQPLRETPLREIPLIINKSYPIF